MSAGIVTVSVGVNVFASFVRGLQLACVLAATLGPASAADWDSPPLSAEDKRRLLAAHAQLCRDPVQLDQRTQVTVDLQCPVDEYDREALRDQLVPILSRVCERIRTQCTALGDRNLQQRAIDLRTQLGSNVPARERMQAQLQSYSEQLYCTRLLGVRTGCDGQSVADQAIGDINLVVEALEALENQGAGLPSTLVRDILRYAHAARITTFAEAANIGYDVAKAAEQVDARLRAYYRALQSGCNGIADFQAADDCIVIEAARVRRFQLDKLRATLDWRSRNSVVREATRRTLNRWQGRFQ